MYSSKCIEWCVVEPDADWDPSGKFPNDNPLSRNGSYITPWPRVDAVPAGPKGGGKFFSGELRWPAGEVLASSSEAAAAPGALEFLLPLISY